MEEYPRLTRKQRGEMIARAEHDRALPDGSDIRRFLLERVSDGKNISGTGLIAQGVQFGNGVCVLRWMTVYRSMCVYGSIEELMAIHAHGTSTVLHWIDQEEAGAVARMRSVLRLLADGCWLANGIAPTMMESYIMQTARYGLEGDKDDARIITTDQHDGS